MSWRLLIAAFTSCLPSWRTCRPGHRRRRKAKDGMFKLCLVPPLPYDPVMHFLPTSTRVDNQEEHSFSWSEDHPFRSEAVELSFPCYCPCPRSRLPSSTSSSKTDEGISNIYPRTGKRKSGGETKDREGQVMKNKLAG